MIRFVKNDEKLNGKLTGLNFLNHVTLKLEVHMKIIFNFLIISFSLFASEESNQQDVDNLLLYETMLERKEQGIELDGEILRQRNHLAGSLGHIADGIKAYLNKDFKEGHIAFIKVKEEESYFALMNEKWYEWAFQKEGYFDKSAMMQLALNRYETHLINPIQEMEWGSVLGIQYYYEEYIRDKPDKLIKFNSWKQSMREKYDKLQPHN